MFNLDKVSHNIREARMKKNMTQMNLADEIGVSFQAVSNWERGNSMPDIGKLSDLCKILDITFEELVGENSKATENIMKIMNDSNAHIPLEDIIDIAPIVDPQTLEGTIKNECETEEKFDLGVVCGLAPFLPKEELDRIAEKIVSVDLGALCGIAPFLSKETLDKLIDKSIEGDVDMGTICGIAVFLSKESLDKLVDRLTDNNIELGEIMGLAPFLSQETLGKLIDKISEEEIELGNICGIAPFLSKETLVKLAQKYGK